jgi:preprotein translocase subunit Sec61beta
MANQQKMQMPGVFGGLMRYDDEYKSKFMMSPAIVIAFIVAIILFVFVLKIFFPINAPVSGGVSAPLGHGGVWWSLMGAL